MTCDLFVFLGKQEYHVAAPRYSRLSVGGGERISSQRDESVAQKFQYFLPIVFLKVGATTVAQAVAGIGAVDLSFAVMSTSQVCSLDLAE